MSSFAASVTTPQHTPVDDLRATLIPASAISSSATPLESGEITKLNTELNDPRFHITFGGGNYTETFVDRKTFLDPLKIRFTDAHAYEEFVAHLRQLMDKRARKYHANADFAAKRDTLVPLACVQGLLHRPYLYRPFVGLDIYPLGLRVCRRSSDLNELAEETSRNGGMILIASKPDGDGPSKTYTCSLKKACELLKTACNRCNRHMSRLLALVDASGPVILRALKEGHFGLDPTFPAFFTALEKEVQTMMAVAYFDPLFCVTTLPGENPSFGMKSSDASPLGGDTFCVPAENVSSKALFPCIEATENAPHKFIIATTPVCHASISRFLPSTPRSKVAEDRLPPNALIVYNALWLAGLGPAYVQQTCQLVIGAQKQVVEQLPRPADMKDRDWANRQVCHLFQILNANKIRAGQTSTVRSVDDAKRLQNLHTLHLVCKCEQGKTTFDLDLSILLMKPEDHDPRFVIVNYQNKNFCTNCWEGRGQNICQKCGEDKNGMICFEKDEMHVLNGFVETISIGNDVRAGTRVLGYFHNFSSGGTCNSVKMQLKWEAGGGVGARALIPSSWGILGKSGTAKKYYLLDLSERILERVGAVSDDTDDTKITAMDTFSNPITPTETSVSAMESVLLQGGGFLLPLPAEAFFSPGQQSTVKVATSEEISRSENMVDEHFEGIVTGAVAPETRIPEIMWTAGETTSRGNEIFAQAGFCVGETRDDRSIETEKNDFLSAIRGNRCFVRLNQEAVIPTFPLDYQAGGKTLGSVAFAAFTDQGQPAKDASKPLGKTSGTGRYIGECWSSVIATQTFSDTGTTDFAEVSSIVQCGKMLFFRLLRRDGDPNIPNKRLYNIVDLPTLPLVGKAGKVPNHRELSRSIQMLKRPLGLAENAIWGFLLQEGGNSVNVRVNGREFSLKVGLPSINILSLRWNPTTQQLCDYTWGGFCFQDGRARDGFMNILEKARGAINDPSTRKMFQSIATYMQEQAFPSNAIKADVARILDLVHNFFSTDALTVVRKGDPAGISAGGASVVYSTDGVPMHSSGMPMHIWLKKRQRETEARQLEKAKLEHEQQILESKRELLNSQLKTLEVQARKRIEAQEKQASDELSRKMEDLLAQQHVLEQQELQLRVQCNGVDTELLSCPLTLDMFVDPVTTPYGHTFERKAIVEWVQETNQCPLTRQPLSVDALTPARTMKALCDSFRKSAEKEPPAEE